MEASFTYEGTVRGQGRPRFRRNGSAYETAQDRAYKKAIAEAYEQQSGVWFGDRELFASIYVTRALPKSRPKRVTSEPDTFTPDADNIAKAVLDALNGVAYVDDKQVTQLFVAKGERRRSLETDRLTVIFQAIERKASNG